MATYSPSGRIGPHAVPLALLCAVALAPAAWAYAWVALELHWLAAAVACLLAACGLRGMTVFVCRWGRVRNPACMGWIGTALGLVFWYGHWAAWAALSPRAEPADWSALLATFAHFAGHPAGLLASILDVKSDVVGYLAVLAWLAELCALVALPRGAGIAAADAVFCEHSGAWAVEIRLEEDFDGIADEEEFIRRLEAQPQRLAAMLSRRHDADIPSDHVTVTLFACAQGDCYVSIEHNRCNPARPDAHVYFANPIAERLRIPGVSAQELLRRWSIALPEQLLELPRSGYRHV